MSLEEFDPDPLRQFQSWFDEARRAEALLPEAMALATADAAGRPSLRMVLLKGLGSGAFHFYTHYDSRKGRELEDNPRAALAFHWKSLERQVRAEGRVEKAAAAESDAYWESRPWGSRVSARVSRQSRPLGSREELEEGMRRAGEEWKGRSPARPEHWGGYLLFPDAMEFWQGRPDRLHERVEYRLEGGAWRRRLLQP